VTRVLFQGVFLSRRRRRLPLLTPRVLVRAPPLMFSSWLLVLSCLVLAVPLWDPLDARPGSDDAVADVSRVLMVFSRWLVGVECLLLALPPDGKW